MAGLIDTTTMPGDTMSPESIEAAATDFRSVGSKVSTRGGTVLTRWQAISKVYEAPEDELLIRAMNPVKTKAEAFGTDMGTAARALDTFAEAVRTVKAEVARIRADAAVLLGGVVDGKVTVPYFAGGEFSAEPVPWHSDPATVEANNALIRRTNDQQEALWAAERACASAIRAAVGLGPVRPVSGAQPGGYGTTNLPDDAPMPWGAASGRTENCGDHAINGVLLEGAGGMVADVGSLLGLNYTHDDGLQWSLSTAVEARKAALTFAAGAASFSVYGLIAGQAIPGPVGTFLRNAQFTVPATVAGLAAIDLYAKDPLQKWKQNPARAGGEAGFNLATFVVAPLKLGRFGRGGPDSLDATQLAPHPVTAGRVFTSADTHVADAATRIERAFPGRVVGVNNNRMMKDGSPREVDIDLGNVIVQVKGGKARNLTGQILDTERTTGVRTIGYAPDILPGAWRAAAERGIVIARSEDELLDYLREFG